MRKRSRKVMVVCSVIVMDVTTFFVVTIFINNILATFPILMAIPLIVIAAVIAIVINLYFYHLITVRAGARRGF